MFSTARYKKLYNSELLKNINLFPKVKNQASEEMKMGQCRLRKPYTSFIFITYGLHTFP